MAIPIGKQPVYKVKAKEFSPTNRGLNSFAFFNRFYLTRFFVYKNILSAQIELHNIDYVLMLLNEFRKSFTKSVVEFPQKTNPNVKPINPSELEALVKAFETNQSVV